MTNSCTINGIKYKNLGRISNSTLSDELKKWHTKNLTASQMIGQQVLIYLESTDKTNPQYQFGNASVPIQGWSLEVNMKNNFGSNVPGNAVFIQIFYDKNCQILALNFGKGGYLVTMTEGQDPVCEKTERCFKDGRKQGRRTPCPCNSFSAIPARENPILYFGV